jgi:hypothetical protein
MTLTELKVAVEQDRRYPLTRQTVPPGLLRFMFDRSRDSHENAEPSQDFLAFRYGAGRLGFVICDGVGGSFLGNLAARLLGEHLVEWLWNTDLSASDRVFEHDLSAFLKELVVPASELIARYRLGDSLSPIVRDVLEEQRAHGSEAMFACGRIDWPSEGYSGQIRLALLGDAQLRILRAAGDRLVITGSQSERWSTHTGLRGRIQTWLAKPNEVRRVMGYSDGFLSVAEDAELLSDEELERRLLQLANRPDSDDLSLIDVAISPEFLPNTRGIGSSSVSLPPLQSNNPKSSPPDLAWPPPKSKLAPPQLVKAQRGARGSMSLEWEPVHGAHGYSIQLACVPEGFDSPLEYALEDTCFTMPPATAKTWYVRLRSRSDKERSPWSAVQALEGLLGEPAGLAPIGRSTFTGMRAAPTEREPEISPRSLPTPKFVSDSREVVIGTEIVLTWTVIQEADNYVLETAFLHERGAETRGEEMVPVSRVVVRAPGPGVYVFRVRARSGGAMSAWSAPLHVRFERDARNLSSRRGTDPAGTVP